MRSEYVFAAAKEINNRFLLCRITAGSARRLQIGSKQPSETINKSLQLIATSAVSGQSGSVSAQLPSEAGPIVDATV
jgi:hypothetical protein